MLEVCVYGVRVRVCFGFFAAVLVYYYIYGSDQSGVATALTACLLHETGHLAVMTALGEKPRAVYLYAGGMKILPSYSMTSRPKRAAILSAGCAVNFLLAGVSFLLGAERLMYINAAVGLLNLLPFSALDGGRLAALFLPEKLRRAAAVFSACAITAAVYCTVSGLSALLVMIFAIAAEIIMK